MDVDKLQRINALASELRKHNFALSSDEAFEQAEQVYEGGNGTQVIVEQKPMQLQNADALSMRRFEMMLEQNNKKYEQEFATYRNAINMLAAQLELLKAELTKASVVAQERPKEKQAELKTEVKEAHPRQGNFQPSDVDIQKMFYFGAKR
ncbi:MAG TPA: hypothetical protein VJJ82_02950 [Candidatus Nanoarchaeia archaeon]|nr:hypothetical protein [Candidatus Nanoarchaeia archaeon]